MQVNERNRLVRYHASCALLSRNSDSLQRIQVLEFSNRKGAREGRLVLAQELLNLLHIHLQTFVRMVRYKFQKLNVREAPVLAQHARNRRGRQVRCGVHNEAEVVKHPPVQGFEKSYVSVVGEQLLELTTSVSP